MLWTDEAVEVLKRLAQEGRSASAIASALGSASRSAVIGKASRIGVRLNGDGRVAGPDAAGRAQPTPRLRPGERTPQRKSAFARFADAEVGVMRRLKFADIRASACRWPLGEPGSGDFAYCGLGAAAGLPYCPGHCRMAYRPASERSSGRRDAARRLFAAQAR
jgi:GcrA cell cycle regulator